MIRELPSVGVDTDMSIDQDNNGDVHIYAHTNDNITVHQGPENIENEKVR